MEEQNSNNQSTDAATPPASIEPAEDSETSSQPQAVTIPEEGTPRSLIFKCIELFALAVSGTGALLVGVLLLLFGGDSGAIAESGGSDATLTLLALSLTVFGLCLWFFFFFFINRLIISPFKTISVALKRIIAEADYRPLQPIKSSREFFTLGNDITDLAARLQFFAGRTGWINQAKSSLLSLAAHQLRTPLSAIRWTLEGLKSDPEIVRDPKRAHSLMITERAVYRMVKLVNTLLTVTAIEEGRYAYTFSRESLRVMITDAVNELKGVATEKNITLSADSEQDLPHADVDKEKMRIVFDNLISNAIHYTPEDGSVTVTARRQKDAHGRESILCAVKDSGIGMSKEEREQLFTKFFRSQKASKLFREGAGLGLSIAFNIVKGHGGDIWVESEPGKGSSFIFTVPLLERITVERLDTPIPAAEEKYPAPKTIGTQHTEASPSAQGIGTAPVA